MVILRRHLNDPQIKAFNAGYQAYRDQIRRDQSPLRYASSDEEYNLLRAWKDGWDYAKWED